MLRKKYDYDLIIIGSGAGGSVGAHQAIALGKKVAIFEKGDIGGECPNWACVPTKALLHSAEVYETVQNSQKFGIYSDNIKVNYHKVKAWKDFVVGRTGASHGAQAFASEHLHLIREKALFVDSHTVEAGGKNYTAHNFLIATGSNVFIPPIPGLSDTGYITFREAVDLESPPESIVVLGAGAVGCEFSYIFSAFGSRVVLVNRSETLLGREDTEVSDLVIALFENRGIHVLTNTTVEKVEKKGNKKIIHYKKGGEMHTTEVAKILIATGKVPELDFRPENAGIQVINSAIKVNPYMQTNVGHIYAAGDIVGPYLFTHTGYYQSYVATHNMFSNKNIKVDYTAVPRCVFIQPEVASVGVSEQMAEEKGTRIKVGISPVAIVGRANTSDQLDGFVKIITSADETIIGAAIVAPTAGEMIHLLTLAVKLRLKAEVLAQMIFAYPTFSEAIKIACSNLEYHKKHS